MGWIRNIRLSIKLYSNAVFVIILLSVLVVVSRGTLGKIGQAFDAVESTVAITRQIEILRSRIANVGYTNLAVAGTQTEKNLAALAETSLAQRAEVAATINELRKLTAGKARSRIEELQGKVAAYGQTSDQAIETRRAFLEALKQGLAISPRLASAVGSAYDISKREEPDLAFVILLAERRMSESRARLLRAIMSNSQEDREAQKQAYEIVHASVEGVADQARSVPLQVGITLVSRLLTSYDKAIQQVFDLADQTQEVCYRQDAEQRADLNAGVERTVASLTMDMNAHIAAASQAVISAGKAILGIGLGVLVVVLGSSLLLNRLIARPIVDITGVMSRLAEGDKTIRVPFVDRTEEIGGMARAVQVFKENALNIERMAAEQEDMKARAEAEKKKAMAELADGMEATIKGIAEKLSAAAAQMQTTATTMKTVSQNTSARSTSVAAAAEQATGNVETAASAAGELAASIQEIGRQVTTAGDIATEAVACTSRTNEIVTGLAEAASHIGAVVKMITDIAEQTNLLALNATIEAARAGDAGKGFAVVAGEVKSLATQTAKATDEIAQQIGEVQNSTREAVEAIQSVTGTIEKIHQIQTGIASAVEEQTAATDEIARNVEQAAAGTRDVSKHIGQVTMAAGETDSGAQEMLAAADELAGQSENLNSEVERFISRIRAA